ncbi:MAG: hypothetical protein WKF43_10730 [Acidimicrobiales bacterium]
MSRNQDMIEALQALAAEKGITTETPGAGGMVGLQRMPDAHEYAWVTSTPDRTSPSRPSGRRGRRTLRRGLDVTPSDAESAHCPDRPPGDDAAPP